MPKMISTLAALSAIAFVACAGDKKAAPAPTAPVKCLAPANSTSALRGANSVSAVRAENESWRLALARERAAHGLKLSGRGSFENSAEPFRDSFDMSFLPEWTHGESKLLRVFRAARDERIYAHGSAVDFKRRALWLYPYNGCFVRASHIAMSFERQGWPRPGKIFAFGDLRQRTQYDPRGTVFWSYHVGAAFRIGDVTWVLDPAVEAERPLTVAEWLSRISDDIYATRIKLCDTFAYTPINACTGGGRAQERSVVKHLTEYLPDEWSRLERAGWKPERVLGEEPPWSQPGQGSEPPDSGTPAVESPADIPAADLPNGDVPAEGPLSEPAREDASNCG